MKRTFHRLAPVDSTAIARASQVVLVAVWLVGSAAVGAAGCQAEEDESSPSETTSTTTGPGTDALTGDPVLPPPADDVPPAGPWRELASSGSRLVAEGTRVGDVASFDHWYDTEFDGDCHFVQMADGKRCLPWFDSFYVLDGPNCDEPMSPVDGGSAPGTMVTVTTGGNCAAIYEVFTVSGDQQPPNESCYTPGPNAVPLSAVRPMTPVDPSTFVAGTFSVTPADGWGDYRLDAEDGAWRILGSGHDGAPCNLRSYGDTTVCVDTRAIDWGECPGHVLACEPVAHSIVLDGCGVEVTAAHTVGTGVDAVAACGDGQLAGAVAHPVGNLLSATDLPAATPALLGQGRIALRALADDAGEIRWPQHIQPLMSPGPDPGKQLRLFDTELGAPCEPEETSDGVHRCLPVTAIGQPLYWADSNCTVPAYQGGLDLDDPNACANGAVEQMDPMFGWVDGPGGPTLHGVVPHDGPIHLGMPGECQQAEIPFGVERMYRAEGGPVPPEFFAETSGETQL
jgi:hypothetical protein